MSKNSEYQNSLKDLYLKKEYQASLELIQKNRDLLSEDIYHYNLGSVYLKLKKLPDARFHLEQALALGLRSPELEHNLELTISELAIEDIASSKSSFDQFLLNAKNTSGSIYLFSSLLLFLILFIFFRIFRLSKKSYAFLALATLPILFHYLYLPHYSYGVVKQDTRIHSGPGNLFADIGGLQAGTKFLLGKEDFKWVFIERPSQISGWIKKVDIQIIE